MLLATLVFYFKFLKAKTVYRNKKACENLSYLLLINIEGYKTSCIVASQKALALRVW
jgi:hypothetical protein